MAVKPPVDRAELRQSSRINSVSSQLSDGPILSPSARTSTSSWSEEPAHANMDISTGHMILVTTHMYSIGVPKVLENCGQFL